MEGDDEIDLLILRHTHLKMLDALELLRFFRDGEVPVITDDSLSKIMDLISVRG